jgi:regulator of cell morphogenesis and NO signaling
MNVGIFFHPLLFLTGNCALEADENHAIIAKTTLHSHRILYFLASLVAIFTRIMSKVALKDTRIAELVDQNYVHAYVLYFFGIRFEEYSELTLDQVCKQKGLKTDQVVKELETPTHVHEADLPLVTYPIDLIIEYLKHSHFIFIKHKLPYIARLVESFKAKHPDYSTIERDLKLVFPLFVEDFIEHIYEEEDTLFCYIQALERASKGSISSSRLYYLMEKNSVKKFAIDHEEHDDEMEGIRKITKDYYVTSATPLHIKVLYHELKDFQKSLVTHARIENEILFPKAMNLENKVRTAFFEKSKLN